MKFDPTALEATVTLLLFVAFLALVSYGLWKLVHAAAPIDDPLASALSAMVRP